MLRSTTWIILAIISFSFFVSPPLIFASETIILSDDFNDGNFNGWVVDSGNWAINNGTLFSSVNGQINILSKIHVGDEWDDYRIELDVNNNSGIDEGIEFRRSQDGNKSYSFNLRHGTGRFGTPEIKFFKTQAGVATQIASVKNVQLLNNIWYHLKIEVVKENIKFWVNNNLVYEYSDVGSRVKKGGVGLLSWTGSLGTVRVRFDNIKVTSLVPTPFLSLPWDYQSQGLDFNEAALSINSYFDHEYPLLSSGLGEPISTQGLVTNFNGERRDDIDYSTHDGYDYGRLAKANLGDPILAAASGWATNLSTCGACGNAILIDHQNGYQTRYYHLLKDGLITTQNKVWVETGQQIGKLGSTGNSTGAHIHFMVIQDKNGDGDFEDNLPDGVTDPFGWQSRDDDPWENYTFFYHGQNRTGNSSFYLWTEKLEGLDVTLTSNGGVFNVGKYQFNFPQNSTNQNLDLELESSPISHPLSLFTSLLPGIIATATDPLGNLVTQFSETFTIIVDFAKADLERTKNDTISFYSSTDGINWVKENTIINWDSKTATAQVNHMTYFALLAKRVDTTAPTTKALLSGEKGQPNWFRSNVEVTLEAKDNEGGLGVDYTLYKLEGEDWEIYTSPLHFTAEGHYKIEFYSADNDENLESVRSTEFNIDQTTPDVSIEAHPKELWPPNGKMKEVKVSGKTSDEHLLNSKILIDDEYDLIEFETNELESIIELEASREGSDEDGRVYIIKVIGEDLAGNISADQTEIIVPHD